MPIQILMPALSPTMESGTLAKWLKKEGDAVAAGDIIAEIETDKATMEFEAIDEGRIGKILVAEGSEEVPINQPIAILLEEGEDASAIDAAASAAPAAEAKSDTKAEAPAETPRADAAEASAKPNGSTAPAASGGGEGGRVFASPLARRMAKEAGIDLARVKATGPHGRVIKADIEAALSGKSDLAPAAADKAAAPAAQAAKAVQPMADSAILKIYEEGSYEVVPHDKMRKIIATRLVEAKQTIPHFYLTLDTEIDALLKLRAQINASAPQDGDGKPAWKVSVNDLVIKALALALQRVPDANVTWTEGGMLRHKRSDVGVAVAIEGGLITPVVRDADTKPISQISIDMKDFAARARERRLAPHEYQGGTTAVSNLGMFGIKDFAAVINPPHATILAVGAGVKTPVVRGDEVTVRTIMTVTLSTDHRAVDGALGAQFLGAFRDLIENPMGMLV